jgi:hypothetical protein
MVGAGLEFDQSVVLLILLDKPKLELSQEGLEGGEGEVRLGRLAFGDK